eukprot:CAMPEP_0194780374 /NCGR_PEP_ID=MMETSP0323_2-20130528/73520_1 /TAXON_ID=2866 ORGANISM="Crypthecodinium cohnii, Strain Seligo" /NCGR_SAMPLE_ID=MMETSP0323_2 /ASSEMBLY_ACC=CAM_ASM_000346 /LENGTH=38 /DNA_ID= /DNA_START= /DNA_END= /DNA_ORIENTATION=
MTKPAFVRAAFNFCANAAISALETLLPSKRRLEKGRFS